MFQIPKVAVSVGGAVLEPDMVMALILGGVDIFRIQQAKFSLEKSTEYARMVRETASRLKKTVEILFDYSGARESIGILEKPLTILPGDTLRFVQAPKGSGKDNIPLSIPHEDWAKLKADERIYIADGAVQARIRNLGPDSLSAVAEVVSAPIKTDDDINFPDSEIHVNPISDREMNDFPRLAELKLVDWISISFIEDRAAVMTAKQLVGPTIKVMAKIETERGVKDISKIVDAADGIMVARGDLAIQAPMERLGIYEREVIKAAKLADKPVMLATQFLESMVTNPIPLRAELSDVATAALLGVDSILLTKEIAIGAYPLRALGIAKGTLAYTIEHQKDI
ncbi:MAG: pyruvate kinase [bacterium]